MDADRCRIKLMPVPSSRAAEQAPDLETTLSFSRVPSKGDVIEFCEGFGLTEFVGRKYLVEEVIWQIPREGPESRVLVIARRLS